MARASNLPALHAIEVSDPVLATMRGKYVSGGHIVYFGVEMITRFTTGAGGTYEGGLYVGIHRPHPEFHPTMTVMSKAEAKDDGTARSPGESGHIRSGGLDRVNGVSQSVQVTGDANAAANQLTMNVGEEGDTSGPSGSGWHEGSAQANTQGGQVKTQVDARGAGVTVTVPGQGVARQQVVNALGLQQQLQLNGSVNRVLNNMNINVAVRAATRQTIALEGVDNALASLRNLPGNGRF